MKKSLTLLLALAMLLAFAACGKNDDSDSSLLDSMTSVYQVRELPLAVEPVTVEKPVIFFSMSMGENAEEMLSLNAYEDEDGNCYLEYVGAEKKVATFVPAVFHCITAEFSASGLTSLNGQSVYEEGTAYASMFVQYADETYIAADFSGSIPQEFIDGYNAMDAYFKLLTADVPIYVPQPMVMGDVSKEELTAILDILSRSGIESLDTLGISEVPMDEYFSMVMGLSGSDGIRSGVSCSPLMTATAYSFVIVTVDDDSYISTVRDDFAANLNWNKWVCVSASNALIAQNGSMVLCLMGSGELYQQTAQAVASAGWTDLQTFENPDM